MLPYAPPGDDNGGSLAGGYPAEHLAYRLSIMVTRNRRRRFLQQSMAAAGAVLWPVPAFVHALSNGDLLRIAVIGVAHRGRANLMGVKHQRIVALCDVDENQLGKAGREFAPAKTFVDFRKMLEQVEREIDAVVVSTPDHTHALASMMALRMGKHCYCEKPLTHSVYEARLVTEMARQKRVATQIGTQIHAGDNYRRVVELVQAVAIGPIAEVHVWSAASYGRQGGLPRETPPVPPGLHWDLWLGPAPQRPYHPDYVPGRWRAWWDFGNGARAISAATTWICRSGHLACDTQPAWKCSTARRLRPKPHPPGSSSDTPFPSRTGGPPSSSPGTMAASSRRCSRKSSLQPRRSPPPSRQGSLVLRSHGSQAYCSWAPKG